MARIKYLMLQLIVNIDTPVFISIKEQKSQASADSSLKTQQQFHVSNKCIHFIG